MDLSDVQTTIDKNRGRAVAALGAVALLATVTPVASVAAETKTEPKASSKRSKFDKVQLQGNTLTAPLGS